MSDDTPLSVSPDSSLHGSVPVTGMYKDWFLDYASYVILERAVPAIEDGLKPVQRRILHAMKEMDDGRFNKVANIIGQSMQYHPHGDASIGDAIVNMGQKDLLIETQGNWGDVRTGDGAAAARYIEARLSKFALDVVFNPQTTDWQLSYDGRKREPVTLPVKFPLLLAQGVEGIAVGLSTKILPHNFRELIEASIEILRGNSPQVLPDFLTGGLADFSDYQEGLRGGKIKVRARIEEDANKTLLIKEIPFGTTTDSLIDSILKANDKGKIKIKKVVDNTAKDVEIQIQLAPGVSPDVTIDALYAFTDCEVSISPNACVIIDEKPVFLTVNRILKYNTTQTKELLRKELEIRKGELLEKLLFSSLEKIFIENRIYRDIEECTTWDAVLEAIDKGLDPYKPDFYRTIVQEDLVRLTEIKIKRISKFDAFKADELMKRLQDELKEVNYNLKHLTDFAIAYYQNLLDKYGKGRERKTEIRAFDTIQAAVVAANNAKLYVNRVDGFVGYGLKKDEYVCECSDLDDIIAIRRDGKLMVSKIQEKLFMGKDIAYVGVFRKNDERMTYNFIYLDGVSGRAMVKRFQVGGVTRDKEYDLTKGTKGSKLVYLTANPNGEAEVVTVYLTQGAKARVKVFDFDFADLEIKGRAAGGNIMTRYPVRKVQFKMEGKSTLGGINIFYDASVGRINTDSRGKLIGNFLGDDKILVCYKNGDYELTSFELTNRYEPLDVLLIQKFDSQKIIGAVYFDGASKGFFVKRFLIETTTLNKRFNFITEHKQSYLKLVTTDSQAQVSVTLIKGKSEEQMDYDLEMLIDVKGWKAIGNKLSTNEVKELQLIESEQAAEPIAAEEVEVDASKEELQEESSEDLEIGSTLTLTPKKGEDEQLGLF
ncbi:MAG: DNA gyrase/topoisomerase IV subunit A [Algoriphagus sp.]|jgi:topoisomerase IV subunit A|uniref:DNA gyrase/topoisomerase IV subunit A n=1 Tax=Algoriphagus sp. TaxID=1872435 RepID=UPI002760ACFE|nr:DNA gyrase/topoisomerase IV subunit A [Algoriphagus sp.]MDP4746890.1 DNA gyrase/topoisomerase IV subunit A [Algoriphagus sp.]MDP4839885.1 DNA gyrase/topoisomerase IV subunit A [Algoriphagus sp.]MDP4903853.1 DNA gyrase/topoisomerase IV subunit A [Algoriphagus sp.]MDP4956606.1 DNA gyrase/topoisomerase IV subunit A [Algoriphagus sp.]